MNELATESGLTFLEAVQTMHPGVQVALLALLLLSTASTMAVVAMALWVRKLTERTLDELGRSSASTAKNAEAMHGVEDVMRAMESALNANTVELARRQ